MANPDLAMAFQNPRVQQAIMDVCSLSFPGSAVYYLSHDFLLLTTFLPFQCSQNPMNIAKYQDDKEVIRFP